MTKTVFGERDPHAPAPRHAHRSQAGGDARYLGRAGWTAGGSSFALCGGLGRGYSARNFSITFSQTRGLAGGICTRASTRSVRFRRLGFTTAPHCMSATP